MDNRIAIFIFISSILGFFEFYLSYRERVLPRMDRWFSNIGMVVISSAVIKLILPLGLSGVAIWAESLNIGIFNFFNLNELISTIFTIFILDLCIYWQHNFSHKWKFLWIFHRVHHTDPDLDFTSALRFHPIEMVYSLGFKIIIVILIGASIKGILLFEIILNSMAMFNHANIKIPPKIEKYLRYIIVTPQMHIIHHSVEKSESDTNFGFNFSFWDYWFKTYTPQFKSDGVIGQKEYNKNLDQRLTTLLTQPFRKI